MSDSRSSTGQSVCVSCLRISLPSIRCYCILSCFLCNPVWYILSTSLLMQSPAVSHLSIIYIVLLRYGMPYHVIFADRFHTKTRETTWIDPIRHPQTQRAAQAAEYNRIQVCSSVRGCMMCACVRVRGKSSRKQERMYRIPKGRFPWEGMHTPRC